MDDVALKIFRLEAHRTLSDALFLRLLIAVAPLLKRDLTASEAMREVLRATIRGLEEDARFAEKIYLSDPAMSSMPDEMRSLYASEYRETVDKMKSYFERYMKGIMD